MPRVVLFTAEPAPAVDRIASEVETWAGEPISLVLVGLCDVGELDPVDLDRPWPLEGEPGRQWRLRIHHYAEPVPADPTSDDAEVPARERRRRERAAVLERGRRLLTLIEGDPALVPLLDGADAFVALDESGVRAAFHLARRHRPEVATDGLVPAVVELTARAAG